MMEWLRFAIEVLTLITTLLTLVRACQAYKLLRKPKD